MSGSDGCPAVAERPAPSIAVNEFNVNKIAFSRETCARRTPAQVTDEKHIEVAFVLNLHRSRQLAVGEKVSYPVGLIGELCPENNQTDSHSPTWVLPGRHLRRINRGRRARSESVPMPPWGQTYRGGRGVRGV